MENKKVQVEIALKDNLSKQLDSLSSKVKKVAQDMQNSVRSMQNSFNNIKINNSGMDSSISDIKKKLKSLGNESVEIDANVNVDTSAVDGLSSGSGIDIGAIGMMGGVSSSMKGITSNVREMGSSLQQAFSAGIQDTESYQNKIRQVTNAFKELQNLNKTNSPILEQGFDRKKLESLKSEVVGLIAYFEQFEGEVVSATDALNALNSMQDSVYGQKGKLNKSNKNQISKDISEMTKNAVPKQGIEIPISIKNIAEAKAKVAELEGNLKRDKIQLNVDDSRLNKALLNYKNNILELKGKLAGATAIGDTKGMEIYQQQIANTIKQITDLNNKVKEHKKIQSDLVNQIKNLKNGSLKSSIAEALGGGESTQKSGNMISNVIDKIKNKFKELTKATNETKKSTEGVKKSLSGFKSILASMGLAFGINQLVNFSKSCVEIASSIAEVQNVLDTVFRVKIDGILHDSAETVNKWAEECSTAFGMTTLQAKKFASNFGAMLTASDVNFDYIDEMSINLTQLAGDLGSFYNISTESAFEKLQSGLAGMVMPLRELGISMTVANLEAFALSRGITTAYNEMSQADQQILRYNYLMQQTQMVMGDFSRTQYSYANSVRTLKNNFASLKAEIGTSMIACLAPIIKVISTIIAYLTALAQAFNNFLRSIGLLKGAVGGVGEAISSIGGSDTTSGLGGVSDGLGGVADSAGGASGAVKDLKKEIKGLMGIDQLNKLPEIADSASGGSGSGGSGGSGGGGAGGAGGIGDLNLDPIGEYKLPEVDLSALDRAMENIQKFIDWCKEHMGAILAVIAGLASGIATYFMIVKWDVIKASIMGVMDSIVGACTGIIGAISAPALAIAVVVGALVAGFTYLYVTCEEFRDRVNKVFTEVGQYIKKVYDAVIKPIGNGIKTLWNDILLPVLMAIWQVVLDVVEAIWSGIESVWERTKPALDYMCEAFGRLWSAISEFYQTCKPVFDLIGSALKVVYDAIIKPVLQWVIETLINLGGTVIPVIVGAFGLFADILGVVFEVASTVIGGIIDFISEFAEACSRNFESVGNWFKGVFSDMKTNFEDKINNFKQGVSDFGKKCKDAWTGIKDKFTTAWDNMKKKNETTTNLCMVGINNFATKTKEHWSSISSWFSDKFNAIKNTCSNVCDGIKNFFSNTHTSITNTFNSIGTWFSNKFTEAKNGISNAFSNVKNVLVSPIENAKNTIKGIVDKICGFFSGARIRFPNIPLPHFSITPSGWSIGDLLKGSIPKLGISWYSQGGIFPSRTLLGVGDANNGRGNNPEAVLPLNVLWEQIDKFADKIVSGVMSNNNNNQDLTVNLLLDGKIVTATVVKNINNQTRLTGVSPLK